MKSSYRIFTIRGIDVRVHITLLVLFLLPFMELGSDNGPVVFAYDLFFLLVLFSSVFVHELAHSLVAIRNKIKVREITLWPLGGISTLGYIKGAWKELKISLAGPLSSLAIGFSLLLLVLVLTGSAPMIDTVISGDFMKTPSPLNFVVLGAYVNLVLGLFNLFLPIFPMDGGRVLRSMLEMLTNRVTATKIAVVIGQGFLIVFIALAVMAGSLWLVFLGAFLFLASISELRLSELGSALEKVDLKGAIVTNLVALSPDLKISEFLQIERQRQKIFPVLDDDGKLAGVFDSRGLGDKKGTVKDLMQMELPAIRLSDEKDEVLMKVYGNGYAFVLDEKGALYGVLTRQKLDGALKQGT